MHMDRRLLRAAAGQRRALLLSVGLALAAAAATVSVALVLARLVARVFLGGADLAASVPLLALLAAAAVARAAFTWGAETSAAVAAVRVREELRSRLARHLVALGPLAVGRERSGELATTLVEGVEALDAWIRHYLPQLALAVAVPLLVGGVVLLEDPLSALVLLLTAPVIPVFMVLIGTAAEAVGRRRWTTLARMGAHFLEVLQGLATLKIFGRSRDEIDTIRRLSDGFRRTTMEVLRVAFLSALVLEMVATVSTAVVAVEVGLRLLAGRLAFEQAFFVLLLAPEFYMPLRQLGARFHAGLEGTAAAGRLFALLERRPGVRTMEPAQSPPSGTPSIRFEGVTFTYEARGEGEETPPAVREVDLVIAPGEHLALAGPSGAGKSTLAALLLRFADPTGGRITADGIPLDRIPPEVWRSRLAWVPQRPHLFAGTVAENVLLGRPGATPEELHRAAGAARLLDVVEELPRGWDTPVGEGGVLLSGGQAQRIALARAFLRDAPLVILDEPTSQLDPELEAELAEATARLLEGRSALVIAHRLATLRSAHRVVVLEAGRVVATGPPGSLLEPGGPLETLFHAERTVP